MKQYMNKQEYMNKQKYETPEIEVTVFNCSDVIRTSNGHEEDYLEEMCVLWE